MGKLKIPRTVTIGPKHKIKVLLVSQATLRAMMDVDDPKDPSQFDGLWIPAYGEPVFGTIYIHQGMSANQKWNTFFHELIHAINDLHAWVIQGGVL